jgi:transposase
MAWRGVTDAQWAQIARHLPRRKANLRGGRPPTSDRKCFDGILWILWTGAPWKALPREYGTPVTNWRLLRKWEEDGTFLELWRAFLAQLNDQEKVRWDECFIDGSFAPARGGRWRRQDQARQWREVDGTGRWCGNCAGTSP